jgi:hypothetical protein
MLMAGMVVAALAIMTISVMSGPDATSRGLTVAAPGQYGSVEEAAGEMVMGGRRVTGANAMPAPSSPVDALFTQPQAQGVLRVNDETYAAAFRDQATVAGKPTTVWGLVLLSMQAEGPKLHDKVVVCDRTRQGLAVALPSDNGMLFFALGSASAHTVPFADSPRTSDQAEPMQAWWADHEHVHAAEVAYLSGGGDHFC